MCKRCGGRTTGTVCRACMSQLKRKPKQTSELELTGGYWYNDHGIMRWRASQ